MTSELHLLDCGLSLSSASTVLKLFRDELARKHGQARRAQAGRPAGSLLEWGRKYLPHYFTLPPSGMHSWLDEQFGKMRNDRSMKLNVLGPRGGAKSTIATLAYPLHAAVHKSEPYIWIISETRHQACAHLENIKSELLDNPRLAADYPAAVGKGPLWRAGSVVLPNGVAIEAFGTGQRIRGRRNKAHRPTLIICDDLQNDGHMQSALQRNHSRIWFHGTLMKAGTHHTNVVNLATALHREALAMQLDETPAWISRVFRSIQEWPENTSLWQEWEELYTNVDNPGYRETAGSFYQRNRQEMDAGAVLLWPEREELYTLMCMRAESGHAAFQREKQNSPTNPDLCEWPESYFDESIWFDAWPENLRIKTLALDPSKGTSDRRGDYSAFVKLGVDRRGVLYLEADLARRPTPQIVADGVELFRKFRPHAFGVETNQFQELLATEFEAEFRKQGLLASKPWMLDNRVNKQVRIRRLGPYLSSRRLRFKTDSPSTRMLIDQLKEFPVADHDDGPDAAEMAIRLAAELLNGRTNGDGLGSRLPVG